MDAPEAKGCSQGHPNCPFSMVPATNEVKSHKAKLNLHGGKQVYGMNYFETYAPVVTWFAIRLMIIFSIIFCCALGQVDFVMAYPQAPIEMGIYMELPQGIQTKHGNCKD